MKTKVFYSHPTAFCIPSAVHLTLVYLGNSIFRDITTLTKKCPPPHHIDFNQHLPQDTTPREAHHRKWEEQKQQQQESQSESEYTQESADLENAQESHDESEKEKEDTSPPHQKM